MKETATLLDYSQNSFDDKEKLGVDGRKEG